MRLLWASILILLLHIQQAPEVQPIRPSAELFKQPAMKTYELRPHDGYFTLVEHDPSTAEEVRNWDKAAAFDPRDEPTSNAGSKTPRPGWQHLRRGAETNPHAPPPEAMPNPPEDARILAKQSSNDVPAYMIVRAPILERESDDRSVSISLERLSTLIKGSLSPPSGPSMGHNWYVSRLPRMPRPNSSSSSSGVSCPPGARRLWGFPKRVPWKSATDGEALVRVFQRVRFEAES